MKIQVKLIQDVYGTAEADLEVNHSNECAYQTRRKTQNQQSKLPPQRNDSDINSNHKDGKNHKAQKSVELKTRMQKRKWMIPNTCSLKR